MDIEEQVCGFELAKRVRELGVKQDSFSYWKIDAAEPYLAAHNSRYMTSKGIIDASAFTVAELGEMLPKCYVTEHRLSGKWECLQSSISTVEGSGLKEQYPANHISMFADTEADARSMMLVYILENCLTEGAQISLK